jgi:heme exporter protein CcmD
MPLWLFILSAAALAGLLAWSKLTQRRLRREQEAQRRPDEQAL